MLGDILNSFIIILIGVNLAPTVGNEVQKVDGTIGATNLSGAAQSLMKLVPLFYVLSILAAGIRGAVKGLADIGLI